MNFYEETISYVKQYQELILLGGIISAVFWLAYSEQYKKRINKNIQIMNNLSEMHRMISKCVEPENDHERYVAREKVQEILHTTPGEFNDKLLRACDELDLKDKGSWITLRNEIRRSIRVNKLTLYLPKIF